MFKKIITIVISGCVLLPGVAISQITTDGSVGAAQALVGPAFTIPQTLGTVSGGNLFHSFGNFNINAGQSANFTTTSALNNVVARVTGGNISFINGPLSLTPGIGAPNFYFINPAGVIFGSGASLNVPGAFHVGTANYVAFSDGNFNANLAAGSTLSAAAPEAFGFLGTQRANLNVSNNAFLSTSNGSAFSLVGGDVTIDNGVARTTNGGDVRVVAVGNTLGEVAFQGTPIPTNGLLRIVNGGEVFADTSGAANAGNITASAGSIIVDRAGSGFVTGIRSTAKALSTGNAGAVDVTAQNGLRVANGGIIASNTLSTGNAGSVTVNTDTTWLDNYSDIASISLASGDTGAVSVSAQGDVYIGYGSRILSGTTSSGDAGTVTVMAQSISTDGDWSPDGTYTGILSLGTASSTGAVGDVNVVSLNDLSIFNSSQIGSQAYGSGDGGDVTINAGSIEIDGDISSLTGITADSVGTGSAGSIAVTTSGNLSIVSGGKISAVAGYSAGDAGDVTVNAGSITLDGAGSSSTTGIVTSSAGNGRAGFTNVTALGDISIINDSLISSDTASDGAPGMVNVIAQGVLSVISKGQITAHALSSGDGGAINVIASSIVLDDFSYIHSATADSGNAGTVSVTAQDELWVLNGSTIGSLAVSSGNAGFVSVSADSIYLNGFDVVTGIISDANPGSTGNAGTVNVIALKNLSIVDRARISSDTFASGNGGDVTVTAGSISLSGGGSTGIVANAEDTSTGAAGNVAVSADNIQMDNDSVISAVAEFGSAGQTGNVLVSTTGTLSLSSGASISIENNAVVLDPSLLMPTTLTITAGNISLNNAEITASASGNANASDIAVSFSDTLNLDAISGITTVAAGGDAGSITIQGGNVVSLTDSQISTSATGLLGNGGNIDFASDTLIMTTGFIQANTAAPNASGGDVTVNVQNLFASFNSLFIGGRSAYTFQPGVPGFNVIQAVSPTGVSGNVSISSPLVDLTGEMSGLTASVVDTGNLGRSPCQVSSGSSLAPVGRGGLPVSANGLARVDSTANTAVPGIALAALLSTAAKETGCLSL